MKKQFSIIKFSLAEVFNADKVKSILLFLIAALNGYLNFLILKFLKIIVNISVSELFLYENFAALVIPLFAYLCLLTLNFISQILIERFEFKIGFQINKKITEKFFSFAGLQNFEESNYIETSYIISNAKEVMASTVRDLFNLLKTISILVSYIYFFADIDKKLLLIFIPAMLPIYFTEKKKAEIFMAKQEAMQYLRIRGYQYKFMALSIQHAQDNRIFTFIPLLKKHFEQLNTEIKNVWLHFELKKLLNDSISFAVKIIVTALVLFIAFLSFTKTGANLQSAVILLFAVYRIFLLCSSVSEQIGVRKNSFGFFEEFKSLMEKKDNIDTSVSIKKFNSPISSIEFKNVSFSYPLSSGEFALKDVSFKISSGESLALVGENGAGKTTIIKLLLRFYEPLSGEILVNGINIKEFEITSYRKAVACVFQDFAKFNMTLYENIYAETADIKPYNGKFNYAEIDALFSGLLEKLPNGYETLLGQELNGIELSGGEWQKTAIARYLAKENASLFLADEPVSAIDPIEEKNIYKLLLSRQAGKNIMLITTHRLACVKDVSKILLMQNGTVVAFDTHTNLYKTSALYQSLYNSQADMYI